MSNAPFYWPTKAQNFWKLQTCLWVNARQNFESLKPNDVNPLTKPAIHILMCRWSLPPRSLSQKKIPLPQAKSALSSMRGWLRSIDAEKLNLSDKTINQVYEASRLGARPRRYMKVELKLLPMDERLQAFGLTSSSVGSSVILTTTGYSTRQIGALAPLAKRFRLDVWLRQSG